MTRILTAVVLLAAALCAWAGDKVLERSEKKTPQWVYSQPDGAIVVTVNAPTLQDARNEAQRELLRQVIGAIASSVTSSYISESSFSSRTGESQDITVSSDVVAAHLPFLKDVSAASCTGTYWELTEERPSRRRSYNYSLLYPFPTQRRAELGAQFDALDKGHMADLISLEQALPTTDSDRQINDALARADVLGQYFFDRTRLARVDAVRAGYTDIRKRLSLVGEHTAPGRYHFGAVLDGSRPFAVSARPTVTSNCAGQITVTPDADSRGWTVTYTTDDCLSDEENMLEITLRTAGVRLQHRAYFSIK